MRYGKIPISLAMFCVCSSQGVFAEESKPTESKPKEQSVYEASTTAPETVQIKSLSKTEFSKFAVGICEKYGFDGPNEISAETDRINLLNKLRDLRKEKFKQLSDPKVRQDKAAKKKVQDEMKTLTDEIENFPNLISNKINELWKWAMSPSPPVKRERIPYGALVYPKWSPPPVSAVQRSLSDLGMNYNSFTITDSPSIIDVPLDEK